MSRIFERTMSGGRVDREAGVIFGVKVLGRRSRNNREYTSDAMAAAVPKYEGKKCYVDHQTRDKIDEDRPIDKCVGTFRNARYSGDAIYADLHLRKKSRYFEEIVEIAESHSQSFGMSHVADGNSRMLNGVEIVDEIHEVFSVDLVTEPATTAGLFESAGAEHEHSGLVAGLHKCIGMLLATPGVVEHCADEIENLVDATEQLDKRGKFLTDAASVGMDDGDAEHAADVALGDGLDKPTTGGPAFESEIRRSFRTLGGGYLENDSHSGNGSNLIVDEIRRGFRNLLR